MSSLSDSSGHEGNPPNGATGMAATCCWTPTPKELADDWTPKEVTDGWVGGWTPKKLVVADNDMYRTIPCHEIMRS